MRFRCPKVDRSSREDGTTIYLTRDLGGLHDKWEKYKFDKHIYVVQAAQSLHFRQLYKTVELMGEPYANRLEHISFGGSDACSRNDELMGRSRARHVYAKRNGCVPG